MNAILGNEKISIKCVRNIDIVPITLNDVFETFREIQDLVEIELNIDECVSVKV